MYKILSKKRHEIGSKKKGIKYCKKKEGMNCIIERLNEFF